ncbi:MAG: hypothetical protein JXA20_02110 [Spirochaetes bacterium]|nr:hypothetical protein [Spirochaetota bacterium]
MRRKFHCMLVIAVAATALFGSKERAASLEISAGPVAWYSWWRPAWADSQTKSDNPFTVYDEFTLEPSVLLGPALSIRFLDRWSISSVAVFSPWYTSAARRVTVSPSEESYEEVSTELFKFDIDLTLSYSLMDYIKLFAGIKYQGYRYDFTVINVPFATFIPVMATGDARTDAVGPGLGIGGTVPLGGGFFAICNVSGIYLRTAVEPSLLGNVSFKEYYNTWGLNASASLAYYLADLSTTVSLGFRFQYLRYYMDGAATTDSIYYSWTQGSLMGDKSDYFYGITVSAVYALRFGG